MSIKQKQLALMNKIELTGNLKIELQTIEAMTALYCGHFHVENECHQCKQFIRYAEQKLDRCVYGEDKPACKHCPIHCYKPEQKNQAREIMRYAGPKMLFKHPMLAIRHLIKATKKFPNKIPEKRSNFHKRKKVKQ